MAAPLLKIDDLVVEYLADGRPLRIIQGFSMHLDRGESYGLVGESGSGKSTIALSIVNYLGQGGSIASGSICLNGTDLGGLSKRAAEQIRRSLVAMVYQDASTALNPIKRIGKQLVDVPMIREDASRSDARRRVLQILNDVRLPDPERIVEAYPHQLSGGQQQRVVIAMALLAKPELLVLDEPTTGLDATVEAEIVELIRDLRAKYDTALLYISHNLGLIARVCDRVGVIYSGLLVEEGAVAQVLDRPKHPYTRGLINCICRPGDHKSNRALEPIIGQVPSPAERPTGCVFQARCSHVRLGLCTSDPITLERIMDGRQIRCARWKEIADEKITKSDTSVVNARGDELIHVRDLTKLYTAQEFSLAGLFSAKSRRVLANDHLDVRLYAGEILGVVGESGSGKSTLARIVAGLETATDGKVEYDGQDVARLHARRRSQATLRAIQMVFQNPDGTLNPSHTVGYTIQRAIELLGDCRTPQEHRKRLYRLLELVKLPANIVDRYPRELSGGEKQRVAIARAFAGDPAVVLCDEPISALDVSVQAAVINLLLDVQRSLSRSLVFISHDLAVVSYLADRVLVMYRGQVVESGSAQKVFSPPYHPYTQRLVWAASLTGLEQRRPPPDVTLRITALPEDAVSACNYAAKCPLCMPQCLTTVPPLRADGQDHDIRCHLAPTELAQRLTDDADRARVSSQRLHRQ